MKKNESNRNHPVKGNVDIEHASIALVAEAMDKELCRLDAALTALQERLSSITLCSPCEASPDVPRRGNQSPLGSELTTYVERMRAIAARIEMTTSVIDL